MGMEATVSRASSRNYKPLELVGAQGVGTGGAQSTCDLYGLNQRLLRGSGQCWAQRDTLIFPFRKFNLMTLEGMGVSKRGERLLWWENSYLSGSRDGEGEREAVVPRCPRDRYVIGYKKIEALSIIPRSFSWMTE